MRVSLLYVYSKTNGVKYVQNRTRPHDPDYFTLPLVATLIRGADIGLLLSSRVCQAEYSIVIVQCASLSLVLLFHALGDYIENRGIEPLLLLRRQPASLVCSKMTKSSKNRIVLFDILLLSKRKIFLNYCFKRSISNLKS